MVESAGYDLAAHLWDLWEPRMLACGRATGGGGVGSGGGWGMGSSAAGSQRAGSAKRSGLEPCTLARLKEEG